MPALQKIIDIVLPPRCLVTGEIVDQQGMLSAEAWGALNFITDPQCNRCGFPFDYDTESISEGNICAACTKSPPPYDKARSVFVYDDASRDIVLGFKHGDQTHAVPFFVPWLVQAAGNLLSNADYLIPVPLHRWRLLRRRFNQSSLMAKYLSKETGVEVLLDGLERMRPTKTQGHLNSNQRLKNVKNAFRVHPDHVDKLKGKNIILVDDVFTTGATVLECTKVLKKAGVESVNILSLARVVKPERV